MITSLQNPRVKLARAVRRRREREREGKLFIEGLRLVRDALAAGIAPDTLFFTSAALENSESAEVVAQHPSVAWEVSPEVMADMSETVTPQGIAALIPLPRLAWAAFPTLLVVADQIRDPGNLGTLLRSAAAAGAQGVIVPAGTVDVWSEKVLRAGMGAHFRLPLRDALAWQDIPPLLEGLRVYIADAGGERAYDKANWRLPCALIVGGEARGASAEAAARADEQIHIPMANAVESLNAAVAGSVMLFEAARQRRAPVLS